MEEARLYTAAYTGTVRVLYLNLCEGYLLVCVLCVACNEHLVELPYRVLIGRCNGYSACSLQGRK